MTFDDFEHAVLDTHMDSAFDYETKSERRRRLFDHLVAAGVDVRAVLEGRCDPDTKRREPGCECHHEEGDSPCPVHNPWEPLRDLTERWANLPEDQDDPTPEYSDGYRQGFADASRQLLDAIAKLEGK